MSAAILMLVVISSGAFGAPLGLPPQPADATIVRAVPDECLLLAYSAGSAEPDPKSSNQTEQLLAESEVQEFLGQMREQIMSAIGQAAKRNPQMQPLAKYGPPIAGLLLTRPAAFYVSKLAIRPGGGPPDLRAALIVNCGGQTDDVKKWLVELESLAALLGVPVDRIKDVKFGDTTLRQLAVPGGLEADWGLQGNYLLVAIGQGAAKELIDRIATPGGQTAAWLVDLQKQADIDRLSTLGYLNVARALEIGMPLIPDPQAKLAIDALGLTGIKLVASLSGLDKQGIVTRTLVNLDGAPQGVLELVSAKPLTLADLNNIPQDATFAAAVKVDAAYVYRRAVELVGKVEPQAVVHFERNLDGLEQSLGFQIEKGLLPSLGDLWTVHASGAEGASPWTGLVVTLSVRDRAKFVDIQERLLNLVKLQAGGPGGPPFSIRETKLKGTQVYQLLPKGPVPVSPAWCVLDDRLVLAATLQTLKAYLARDAKSAGLADVVEVADRFAAGPAPSLLMYQDTKSALRGMYAMIQAYGPIATGALSQQGIDFDLPPLPSLESLDPHIVPMVELARRTKQGLSFERYQTVPVIGGNETATTGVLVALLVPAVQAAREAARRAQSMNNMKSLALAILNDQEVHKHFPAQAITDASGKPLLSWRVAILPYVEEQELYKQFHLDEPWDSEHNRALIDKMPTVYLCPAHGDLHGKTVYLVPAGKKTMFPLKKGLAIGDIKDGLSHTIMLVEALPDHAVEWTRPEDLPIDPTDPVAGLSASRAGMVFLVAFADGSVHTIANSIDPATLRALFTPADGEVIDSNAY
jgi:hypothetical protein